MAASQITNLLDQWRQGRRGALDELMPLVYAELKRIASAFLEGERPGATLQVTALVHEAYLRLVDFREPKFESRKHFYVVAAQVMRRILVDHARRRNAGKRAATLPPDSGLVLQSDVDVLALDDALNRLAASDPKKARLGGIALLRWFERSRGGRNNWHVASLCKAAMGSHKSLAVSHTQKGRGQMNHPPRPEVEEAFAAALELSEAEQQEFLAREYAHDPELRSEVETLLRAYRAAGAFLEPGNFTQQQHFCGDTPRSASRLLCRPRSADIVFSGCSAKEAWVPCMRLSRSNPAAQSHSRSSEPELPAPSCFGDSKGNRRRSAVYNTRCIAAGAR